MGFENPYVYCPFEIISQWSEWSFIVCAVTLWWQLILHANRNLNLAAWKLLVDLFTQGETFTSTIPPYMEDANEKAMSFPHI